MADELDGKLAYKNHGYFKGLIGRVEKNNFITPYIIVFSDGGGVGVHGKDIILVEEGAEINENTWT